MKKIVSLFLCVLIFLPSFCFAEGNLIEDTARIVLSGGASFGAVGGEWAVTGLARSGSAVPDGYFDEYYKAVEKYGLKAEIDCIERETLKKQPYDRGNLE